MVVARSGSVSDLLGRESVLNEPFVSHQTFPMLIAHFLLISVEIRTIFML